MTERKSSNSRTGTQVSREHLQVLSKSLSGCWMDVARYLEMEEDTITSVEGRNPRKQEMASMDMLLTWKRDCGTGATYPKMDNALRKAGRTDLAEKLQDLRGRLESASHAVSRERSEEAESRDETDAPTSRLLPYYEMSSTTQGICLLLTYDKFEQSNERIGNESDKVNLEKIFKKLGFKIIEKHNLKLQATLSLIRDTAAMDHRNYDCFALFICSHGGKDTFSTADDEKIAIQEVLTPFRVEHCPSLANKPKIFFFNSCRGKSQHELFPPEDDGEHDRGPGAHIESYRPNEADFCISLSTVPGYDNVDIDEAIPRLQNVVSAFGARFDVSNRFRHVFPGFSAELSYESVQLIRRFNFVDFIEEDGIARTEQVGWNLDRIDQRNLPLDQGYSPSRDGNGANIYVLDTGVNINHVDITGRAFVAFDAFGGDGIDCSGHGSHCAGVAGGTTYGVAKGSHLYSVRVLSCSGSGAWSNVIAGMDWIAANAIWPAVVSMSVGGIVEESVDLAAQRLVASGIPLVTSAGNDDWDACDYSPARVPEVITVGATREDDRKYFWSNHGYCVDIFAPGVDVVSAWYTDETATRKRSGTSMACPHVSGAIAIMLAEDSALTPSEISQQLAVEATANVLWDERLGKVVELPEGSPNLLLHIP